MSAEVIHACFNSSLSTTTPTVEASSDAGAFPPADPRTPQAMLYLNEHQYALPVHQLTPSHYPGDSLPTSGEQTPRPENTLRRKTPNGTLNAGYEASAEHINPNKHQLVPFVAPARAARPPNHAAPTQAMKRTFLQHRQLQTQTQTSQASRSTATTPAWLDAPTFFPAPNRPPPPPLPTMDSMLHQMPLHQPLPLPYQSQTVPSVIQPSFNQPGPTASGVQANGPYGPYWHDGTFVPYRPAVFRDPRFYHHPLGGHHGGLTNPQLAYQPPLWQHQAVSHGLWSHRDDDVLDPLPTYHPDLHFRSLHGKSATSDLSHAYCRSNEVSDVPQYASPASLVDIVPGQSPHNLSNASAGQIDLSANSPSGRQRERIFTWSLQQYRELLSFIHHTRRQQQHIRQVRGQPHVSQKPSFYPRPPRPSRQRSATQVQRIRDDGQREQHPVDWPRAKYRSNTTAGAAYTTFSPTTRNDSALLQQHSAPLWTSNSFYPPDGDRQRANLFNELHENSGQLWSPASRNPGDKFQTLRRSVGSQIAASASPLQHEDTPPARATAALSHLTQLCLDCGWQWVDGMHLAGCLAYGLGDYQKALQWYTLTLETDPKHLEATSNLAATQLALGRRHEAETHWVKVVRAAPNHFEAVEHLVGLLCTDQRSKDAIKVIEYVENTLRQQKNADPVRASDRQSDCSTSTASRSPCVSDLSDKISYDFDADVDAFTVDRKDLPGSSEPGFGSSGFSVPGCDNGRILALIHAKGNMLYGLGDISGAAKAFEDAVLIAVGRRFDGVQGLVEHILTVVSSIIPRSPLQISKNRLTTDPILLTPEQALATAKLCFPYFGELPGLQCVPGGSHSIARKAIIATTSNSLLSLAKTFQDGMSNSQRAVGISPLGCGVRDILALYYLSLSLQPSPSTANNVGILLASVQQVAPSTQPLPKVEIPGVVAGSGIALALQYYNYGLQLDSHHAHLYTNLGSLLKDIGQLDAAINMYERAVKCDGKFDIALANLANAVKDKGRINDAILYYRRAVEVSPDFAEAVCGLANALNSVCAWQGRGGIADDAGARDRWHVDGSGLLLDARLPGAVSTGWVKQVVNIVDKQLTDGENWGVGTLTADVVRDLVPQLLILEGSVEDMKDRERQLLAVLLNWSGKKWEGARLARLIERATRRIGWHRYHDVYVKKKARPDPSYDRPQFPASLTVPAAPTVLPFHTFTCPMSAKQIRLISQRNGLRISVSTLRAPWLPKQVYTPPAPPAPSLKVGYISSDFNNHPLAHLMQSVFGLHNPTRITAYCYATTASDNSAHRRQIQAEAPVFHDASSWSSEKVVNQIIADGVHILVNLNGYTRGARNDVFAARPAPIQMSFMGFAGTLGAEWCDYLLADDTAVPPETLRPWRRNVDLEDQMVDDNSGSGNDEWVYGENLIYCRDTFFCCDHKQSAPGAGDDRLSWDEEQKRRWKMRKELFPQLSDDVIIFGNFNQLYKIEPTTFRTWLRILSRVPNSILWLLRFPDVGEMYLMTTARQWAGAEVARRVVFTDVAPKQQHISRASVCDLVLDTAECNAHTTAADVLWSGTPLLTLPRYSYKMCSRMAASILKGALPKTDDGERASRELIATGEDDYEEKAVALGRTMSYGPSYDGRGLGRLVELRHMLYHARWTSALFDTKRWVEDLEDGYTEAWRRWVAGEGGDIWLEQIPRGG